MPPSRAFFGIGGSLTLLLGALLKHSDWLYRSDFAAVDYDYVRNESLCKDVNLAEIELPCLSLSAATLRDFERQGFVVLQQAGLALLLELFGHRSGLHGPRSKAIPVAAVRRLSQEVQCASAFPQSHQECLTLMPLSENVRSTKTSMYPCMLTEAKHESTQGTEPQTTAS